MNKINKLPKIFKLLIKQENLFQDAEFVYLKTIDLKVNKQDNRQRNKNSKIKKQQNKL